LQTGTVERRGTGPRIRLGDLHTSGLQWGNTPTPTLPLADEGEGVTANRNCLRKRYRDSFSLPFVCEGEGWGGGAALPRDPIQSKSRNLFPGEGAAGELAERPFGVARGADAARHFEKGCRVHG